MNSYIKQFKDISIADIPAVGGKNASLGEMISKLSPIGIQVPDGFATTAFCFEQFLCNNNLKEKLESLMQQLDRQKFSNLRSIGQEARELILNAELSEEMKREISAAYKHLLPEEEKGVAVRSSATAEDLPQASFAGQHESYLNVKGTHDLLNAIQKCFASLYTDRAIKYREDNGFDHSKVLLSVGVQIMVRADLACAGVGFTLEPESGFRDVIHLSGVWGLGENIVQGTVTPDEFFIFKPALRQGKKAIIQKKIGDKSKTMVYADGALAGIINTETPVSKRILQVLSDDEIMQLAKWALAIEDHYKKPMDIEWAKDGLNNKLYILQARPETVHSRRNPYKVTEYSISEKKEWLVKGQAIGSRIASGAARILRSPADADRLKEGEIVVAELTSPDWDPILKKCAAIITDRGGRTSHASIVARELGVPAIVGCGEATRKITDGEILTVSCCEGSTGYVYQGRLQWKETSYDFSNIAKPENTEVMLIAGDPDKAFKLSFLPNDGVGLMRIEFIINHNIRIHPMALARFDEISDENIRNQILQLTQQYTNRKQYFIDKLSQGIATVAAAFYPKKVLVRMSDFKSNEYANLLGGKKYEPHEENPMLGFRGASRYYHPLYMEGFRLECEAIKYAREEIGLDNIKVMIPFCRTIDEAKKVLTLMSGNGLDREKDPSLEIYVMAEIPSNVLLAEQFALLFDGFSIGSNDLTQLTLGIDRDSEMVSGLFSENNEAARRMISMAISKAHESGVSIGLCGQAPSDSPEFAQFLVEQKIDSISFNPDALIKGIENINLAEKRILVPA